MEERKKNIISILIKTAIGFVAAFIVMSQIQPDWSWTSWATMAMLCSTIPHGWSIITKYIGSWIIFDGAMFICGLLLKLVLSLFLGWILVPINLAWNIGMYFWERHKLTTMSITTEE